MNNPVPYARDVWFQWFARPCQQDRAYALVTHQEIYESPTMELSIEPDK